MSYMPYHIYFASHNIVSRAGRRFYRLQLYTVITLHTQLNTRKLDKPQFDTSQVDTTQIYTATTRHATTVHRPHVRKFEALIE